MLLCVVQGRPAGNDATVAGEPTSASRSGKADAVR